MERTPKLLGDFKPEPEHEETRGRGDNRKRKDEPCDFTLISSDGKEYNVHRDVISEPSLFFEKLLCSNMKESQEGLVRLEVVNDALMKDILKFIYNGTVQISTREKAEDLVIAADYLCIERLKTFAGKFLEGELTISNCISTFNFAKKYDCEELAIEATKFIHMNFLAVTKGKDFLSLSSDQVQQWISSDDIIVNVEEDVFKVILRWTEEDKDKRKVEFADLFRHVRLIFVSRDYLLEDVVTNPFVSSNKFCLNCVTSAVKFLNQGRCCDLLWSQKPRKSLEFEGIVAYKNMSFLLYCPDTGKWFRPDDTFAQTYEDVVSCHGKIYSLSYLRYAQFDSLVDCWVPLTHQFQSVCDASPKPVDGFKWHQEVTVVVRGDIFILLTNFKRSKFILWKYSVGSGLWQCIPSCQWRGKNESCIIGVDKYIYSIGGFVRGWELTEAWRYDTTENAWEQIADILEAQHSAFGTSCQDKIFIAGGRATDLDGDLQCEVYNTSLNQWQFIADMKSPRCGASMLCVNDSLYIVGGLSEPYSLAHVVERYDFEKNEWLEKTTIPHDDDEEEEEEEWFRACSVRLFKGLIKKHFVPV